MGRSDRMRSQVNSNRSHPLDALVHTPGTQWASLVTPPESPGKRGLSLLLARPRHVHPRPATRPDAHSGGAHSNIGNAHSCSDEKAGLGVTLQVIHKAHLGRA